MAGGGDPVKMIIDSGDAEEAAALDRLALQFEISRSREERLNKELDRLDDLAYLYSLAGQRGHLAS
jgi:hypothetical protein